MQFLHYQVKADKDQIIQVVIDNEASVKLMDTFNFSKYQLGKTPEYFGGIYPASTVEFRVHKLDDWHVVVDLDGKMGVVKAYVNLVKC